MCLVTMKNGGKMSKLEGIKNIIKSSMEEHMNLPEGKISQERPFSEQKEKENNPIFVSRFGFGPHTIKYSNWYMQLAQDLDSFFQSSELPQRNILYIEDASGSQTFAENLKRGYKRYGSWLRAYFWADGAKAWRQELGGEDRFPPIDFLDKVINIKTSSGKETSDAENSRFMKELLGTVDIIVNRKNIAIEVVPETRRNQ